jgi:hypothetical protein
MDIDINLRLTLDDEFVESMMIDMPSYIAYWGSVMQTGENTFIYEKDDDGQHSGSVHTLPSDWVEKGLNILFERGKQPGKRGCHRMAMDIVREDYDRDSLDALVQAAIFGELRYG